MESVRISGRRTPGVRQVLAYVAVLSHFGTLLLVARSPALAAHMDSVLSALALLLTVLAGFGGFDTWRPSGQAVPASRAPTPAAASTGTADPA